MKYYLLFFLFLLNHKATISQESITFLAKNESLLIGDKISILEDRSQKLNIKDILKAKNQQKFQRSHRKLIAYSPTSAVSVFWLKLTITNQSLEELCLALEDNFILELDVYASDSAGKYRKIIKTGTLRPYQSRQIPVINGFWLPLKTPKKQLSSTFYIRIRADYGITLLPKLATISTLYQEKSINDSIVLLFIGVMLTMTLYNALLFLYTKAQIYFLYVGYLVSFTPVVTFINNYPMVEYFTNYQYQGFWHYYFTLWALPSQVFLGLFCIKYLELKKNFPKGKKAIEFILYFLSIEVLLGKTGVIPFKIHMVLDQFSGLALAIIVVGIAFYLFFFKKLKQARYYLLGWSFYLMGFISMFIYLNVFFIDNIYFKNIIYLGTSLEVLMFSLALGDRLRSLKREKELVQGENLKLVKEQRDVLEEKVEERTQEIIIQKEKYQKLFENLTASINYAQNIQQAILPTQEKIESLLPESFIFFKPRDVVSGDFYFFTQKSNKIIIAAVDCTGHGIPGAFMSLIGNELLNEIINANAVVQADIILNLLRDGIIRVLKQKETNNKDGMDIALCSIDRFSEQDNEEGNTPYLEYAGAGNPLIYFQENEMFYIKPDKIIIGGFQNYLSNLNFTLHRIALNKPTTFYIFSDGIQDQFGGENNKKFTRKRLRDLLGKNHQKPMQEQKEILNQTIKNWQDKGNEKQIDDILVVGVKI